MLTSENIGQIIGALVAISGLFVPFILGRYRDRNAHEKEKENERAKTRYWQGYSREALDLASNYRTLVNSILATRLKDKDTVDLGAGTEAANLETDYDRLMQEYRRTGLAEFEAVKEKSK